MSAQLQLDSPITTPCGLVFPNRLVKAAMAELMAVSSSPSDKHITAYHTWGSGGWGAVITGNVDVSPVFRGDSQNVGITPSISSSTRDAWKRWAHACQHASTPTIVQLVHPGRQSAAGNGNRGFFDKSIAPSPLPQKIGDGVFDRLLAALLFGTPREMSIRDIEEVVQQFAAAAKLCWESGFRGVQIHAAHGYLLTQFLSPKSNIRTDAYGGTPAKRARIVLEVIRAIRAVVPASFCVGIKLNSADVGGNESLEESLEQVGLIAAEGIDFLEISGGSLENMRMATGDKTPPRTQRTLHREAFFLDYSRAVRARYPHLILMVTGGFRTRSGIHSAIQSNACDLAGLGRPSIIWPKLPKEIVLNKEVADEDAKMELEFVRGNWLVRMIPLKIVGFGVDVMYYAGQINGRLGVGRETVAPGKGR